MLVAYKIPHKLAYRNSLKSGQFSSIRLPNLYAILYAFYSPNPRGLSLLGISRRMPRCDSPPCLLKTVFPSLHPQFDPPSVSRLPPADLWSLPSRLQSDEKRKILFHLVGRQSATDALILWSLGPSQHPGQFHLQSETDTEGLLLNHGKGKMLTRYPWAMAMAAILMGLDTTV